MMLLFCAALQGHKQHLEILQQMMDAAGVSLIFLPKHCPELNPIELVWSKMKCKIRRYFAWVILIFMFFCVALIVPCVNVCRSI